MAMQGKQHIIKQEETTVNPVNAPEPRTTKKHHRNRDTIKNAAIGELATVIKKLARNVDVLNVDAMMLQLDIINKVRATCEEIGEI
jgi:hypothetical protein